MTADDPPTTEQYIPTLTVRRVNGNHAFLTTSRAISTFKGMEYAIYPKGALVFDRSNLLARAIVTEVSDHELKAQAIKGRSPLWSEVKSGCLAILFERPYQQLTLIQAPYNDRYRAHQMKAMDKIHGVQWEMFFSGIAPLLLEGTNTTDKHNLDIFTVMINEDGKYELWVRNQTGMKLMPNFGRCGIPEIFLDRVAHLAQYQIIKDLRGPKNTPLSGKFLFQIKDYPTSQSNQTPVDFNDGDEITIVFENNSNATVNLSIFDLQPLWGISQIYPAMMDHEIIHSGDRRELPFRVSRPPGISRGTFVDTIKAFVTVDQTCFRPLEMGDIDISPDSECISPRGGASALQSLLDHLTATQQNGRALGLSVRVWETLEIFVPVNDSSDNESTAIPSTMVKDGGEEVIDEEEETLQMIVDHLSTVIVSRYRDLEILPYSKPTIFYRLQEAAANLWLLQFLSVFEESRCIPGQRLARWRCRCGKVFTDVIPPDLENRYRRRQATSQTTTGSSSGNPSSHKLQLAEISGAPELTVPNSKKLASWMDGGSMYLCIDTRSFFRPHTISAFVALSTPREGLHDDDLFRHLRTMYSKIRGTQSVGNVSSFKFVKFQRSHPTYVSCYEREEMPPMSEGYSYEAISTPPLRQDELVHFFHSPECIQGSIACLRRIPKRTSGLDTENVYGWGLYAQEKNSVAGILVRSIIFLIALYVAFCLRA